MVRLRKTRHELARVKIADDKILLVNNQDKGASPDLRQGNHMEENTTTFFFRHNKLEGIAIDWQEWRSFLESA